MIRDKMRDLNMAELQRFTRSQRYQMYIVALSILMLALTGFPITYNEIAWVAYGMGGYKVTMFLHRVSAALFIGLGFYHFMNYTLTFLLIDDKFIYNMLPSLMDLQEFIKSLIRAFRLQRIKIVNRFFDELTPQAGKYRWQEKIDYWGLVIFAPVSIITGLLLWFPYAFVTILPQSYLIPLRTLHRFDAMLAVASFLLHLYYIHLAPDTFPMRDTIFTGTISEEMAAEEYPLWYEAQKGGGE